MSAATTVRNFDDATVTLTDDGGNSNTLALFDGTVSFGPLNPAGREAVETQAQGAFVGDRRGNRVPVEITVEGHVARMDTNFHQQLMGTIAGFVSTVADIGDGIRSDLQIDESYSTDSRVCTFDDCRGSFDYSVSPGASGRVSVKFSCIGPVVIDGHTYVAAR